MRSRCAADRRGFSLVELLVALAIVATLAAVITTALVSRVRQGGAAALVGTVDAVAAAVGEFRSDVGRYPSSLLQLHDSLGAGALDACGIPFPLVMRARWRGPYLDRAVPAGGLPVGGARLQPTLVRDPAAGPGPGRLRITATEVDSLEAVEVGAALDGDDDPAAGSVRWTATGPGIGTLQHVVSIRGC